MIRAAILIFLLSLALFGGIALIDRAAPFARGPDYHPQAASAHFL